MVPFVEKLTHATKKNPCPTYGEFDVLFHKFPSYFRRSAIADAFGIVKSYRSNYANWEYEKHPLSLKYFIKTIGYGLKLPSNHKICINVMCGVGKKTIRRWLKSEKSIF
jgi:hypothetical protein